MEESKGFRQQRKNPFCFSWYSASAVLCNSVCSAVYSPGCGESVQSMSPVGPNNSPVYISCGPKIRFNMTGRCLRPWSVKAGQTSRLHRPEALRDLEGWQGLKPTEGRSFKWNGFHWWNVRLFSLREMSPRGSVALSPSLFKSFTYSMKEWSPRLVAVEKGIMLFMCME